MPSLTWPGKSLAQPQSTTLVTDSIIFPGGRGYPEAAPVGRVILGDNLRVMAALLTEYEGQLDLIYADPPFFTNRTYPARIGRGEDSRKPEQWALGEGYADHWPHLDAYLDFLFQRLSLMHRLLSPRGTLYLHLDWHANSYARLLLDEIFGADHLLNEIVWTYHGPSPIKRAFNRKHDTLLAYVKGEDYIFNSEDVREAYNPSTVKTFKASSKAGFGKIPDLERGKVPEDWWYFPVVARLHKERTGYPTQKPEGVLERIIRASSNRGGMVADFFCGSGTAPVVASRLGRNYVAGDSSFRAVHTTRRRLCAVPAAPFSLERELSHVLPLSPAASPEVERTPDEVRVGGAGNLDYWEVDPAWDGMLFRSALQAFRGDGKAELPRHLGIKTGRNVCVRMVTAEGALIQRELHV